MESDQMPDGGGNLSFKALTDEALADLCGKLDGDFQDVCAVRDAVRAEVRERGREISGLRFKAVLIPSQSTSWKADKLAAELGDRIRHFRKISKFVMVKTSALQNGPGRLTRRVHEALSGT